MAAYAALVTLINLTDQILNHPRRSFSFDEKQIQSLQENLNFFLDFIEEFSSHGGSKIAQDLESRIAAAAHAAEDAIESQVVDQILDGSASANNHGQRSSGLFPSVEIPQKSFKNKVMKAIFTKPTKLTKYTSLSFLLDLQKVIRDMNSIKKKVLKVRDESRFKVLRPKYSIPAASSRPLTSAKNTMVGSHGYLIQIMDVLTGQQSSRKTISIVGMGGIGKTTLATTVYQDPLIMQYFDFRAWATISQQYDAREILSQLLSDNEKISSSSRTVDQLGEQLYKMLIGSRYLIVLDDMWSNEVWDELKFFFPDNGNRSRVVITTRLLNLPCHSSFVLDLLDEDTSWKLFCRNAFGEDHHCPSELERFGKKIVEKCRGLPLSITVIGSHLGKSPRTEDYWEYVARDINSILTSGEDEQCLSILYLSYSHLPVYLKPCFLYTGVFEEDRIIDASTLIKLWVAEGFLKPNDDQTLEEIAKSYLKDLTDRNLVLVRKWKQNGEIKTCSIHDLLRELCLRVAEKEKFLCVLKLQPRTLDEERRLAIHGDFLGNYFHFEVFHALKSANLVRSVICKPGQLPFHFKLLKILKMGIEAINKYDVNCLKAKFEQVNLRYLSRELEWSLDVDEYIGRRDPIPTLSLPSSISQLWNLQTLIIKGRDVKIIAPSEIWEMLQLRHVELGLVYLPGPVSSHGRVDNVLSNLQTLSKVGNFKTSEEVCRRMPNLKKLEISYNNGEVIDSSSEHFQHNLSSFSKLESLKCHFLRKLNWRDFALNLTFPSSLRKLSLTSSCLLWGDMTMLGLLPNLEVLKLTGRNSAGESEWTPVEGEFLRLRHLEIVYYDLVQWNAESSHFPILESLVLIGLCKLGEIPSGIGDIPTLRNVYVDECSTSAAISAMRIVEEQEELGNEGLQVQVGGFWRREDEEILREMMKEEGFTSNNIRIT